jgi:hypothetical protein
MSDDAPRWTFFSSAFSIILSVASDSMCRISQATGAVKMRQLCWALIFQCAACSIAIAADTYLFDVIKNPSYARALTSLLESSRNLPAWTREVLKTKGDYVGSPVVYSTVEGTRYELFFTCKAHDCADNQLQVMFSPNGAQAWGALKEDGKSIAYLGAPSPAQQAALKSAMEQ